MPGKLYSDEELLDDLREVNEQVDGSLSQRQYNELGRFSYETFRERFGSFNNAKEIAGVEKVYNSLNGPSYDDIDLESRKERVKKLKDNKKCESCGKNPRWVAMDFHHVNPSEKEKSISRLLLSGSQWGELVEEMKKCVLLCSNCHREVEHGLREETWAE